MIMRFFACILFFSSITNHLFSQVYINWSPSRIAEELIYIQHNNPKSITDVKLQSFLDSLHADVNGIKPLKIDCRFSDTEKNCIQQQVSFECDECMQNWVNDILANKKLGWKKTLESTYISSPEESIEFIIDKKQLKLLFKKSSLSKEEYKKVYKSI